MPGFTPLTEQVLVREPVCQHGAAKPAPSHPDAVLIYGWGDGLPKHVAKYADRYHQLYPRARQVVVLSPMFKTVFTDLESRAGRMGPVLAAAFAAGPRADGAEAEAEPVRARVLVHAMSNAGLINYGATLHAYRQTHGAPLPHRLLVLDSAPGSPQLDASNLGRWSRAVALGVAPSLPWPRVVTRGLCALFIAVTSLYSTLVGREGPVAWTWKACNDDRCESGSAARLYLYGKEDDLVGWEDVERHAAEARVQGWTVHTELFARSHHVTHARVEPERYWTAISRSWDKAAGGDGSRGRGRAEGVGE